MRKLFWPLLVLTVIVAARHIVMTAYLTNRSVQINLDRAARQTDPYEQATHLQNVIHTLDSYRAQVSFFSLIDRYPKTQNLDQLYRAVNGMYRAARYGANPEQTARAISQQITTHRGVSVAVIDDQQKMVSMIVFWVLAILTGISGLLKTMAPPE